jgi:hypothetical protein
MKKSVHIAAISILLLASAGSAWYLQSTVAKPKTRNGSAVHAVQAPPSPAANFIVACLGGFRSLAAEIIWFRADRLQNEGRYAELAQLGAWLTFLEPHTPEIWAYVAWNLSYNISVMMPTPEDRWRWVESGLRLLRDDGLRLNPNSPELCREIAWLFLLKIAGDTDNAAPFYREKWSETAGKAQSDGKWETLSMSPGVMAEIEKKYRKLDWRDANASAVYWSYLGVNDQCKKGVEANLRQIRFLAFMQMAKTDPSFAQFALAEMKESNKLFPSKSLTGLIRSFAMKYNLNPGD